MSDHYDPEEQLTRLLRGRANAMAGAGLELEDVRHRARGIRRRRRLTVAASIAAAVAVIVVPSAVLLNPESGGVITPAHHGTGGPSGTGPTAVSTTNKTPTSNPTTSSTTPPSTPTQRTLTLQGFTLGGGPSIGYVQERTMHLLGGGTQPLPTSVHGEIDQFSTYLGGWVFTNEYPGKATRQVMPSGHLRSGFTGSPKIAIDAGLMNVAYVQGDVIHAGTASSMGSDFATRVKHATDLSLAGFLSSGVLVYNARPGDVRALGTPHGEGRVPGGLYLANATTSAGDLISGYLSGGSQGGVVAYGTGTVLWHSTQWLPESFSPNGQYVAAVPLANNGDVGELAILDARTGQVLTHFDATGTGVEIINQLAWDTDNSLLFVALQPPARVAASVGQWAILRLTPQRSMTRATPVIRHPIGTTPFGFGATP